MSDQSDGVDRDSGGFRWQLIWKAPGWVLLVLCGVVLVNLAGIGLGVLAAFLLFFAGLNDGWAIFIGIVVGVIGVLMTTKFAFWVGEKLQRPKAKSLEEMAEVFE